MKKQLLAMMAVAALGVSVASATPQTQFVKGQFQLDAGAINVGSDAGSVTESTLQYVDIDNDRILDPVHWIGKDFTSDRKWNFQGGLTYGLGSRTAIQYAYTGLHVKDSDFRDGVLVGPQSNNNGQMGSKVTPPTDNFPNRSNEMHEVNLIQSLNKHLAIYGGWARISGDYFDGPAYNNISGSGYKSIEGYRGASNIAQVGAIAKTNIGSRLEVYAKGALGTHNTSIWEAGLGFKATDNLDLNVGYKYINTNWNDDDDKNITFDGLTVGLSYRFGAHKAKPVTPAPVYTAPAVVEAPVREVEPNKDYYVQSIHFDYDKADLKASQEPNLQAMVTAAQAYPNNIVKLLGNTDADGSNEYNQALSQRRVQAVAQYAVNHGVDANRLVGLAFGKTRPVADNSTEEGKAENRRVDVFVNR